MKELEPDKPVATPESADYAQLKAKHLSGSVVHIRGLTLFECDPKNKTVTPAKYREIVIIEDGKPVTHKQVIMNPGCLYREFLNLKNAIKKFSKYT
jgi:hypothetical protein